MFFYNCYYFIGIVPFLNSSKNSNGIILIFSDYSCVFINLLNIVYNRANWDTQFNTPVIHKHYFLFQDGRYILTISFTKPDIYIVIVVIKIICRDVFTKQRCSYALCYLPSRNTYSFCIFSVNVYLDFCFINLNI